jgi:hypothetical protein
LSPYYPRIGGRVAAGNQSVGSTSAVTGLPETAFSMKQRRQLLLVPLALFLAGQTTRDAESARTDALESWRARGSFFQPDRPLNLHTDA